MITKEEFKGLFNFLTCNNWKFPPSQDKLKLQASAYYEKLKNYDYAHLKTAFNNIFDAADQEQFPSIQRIKNELSSILLVSRKAEKPRPHQKIINKLLRRMIRQSQYIISKYGNNKPKLARCGTFYSNLMRKARNKGDSVYQTTQKRFEV